MPFDTASYLKRIGCEGPVAATPEVLRLLHEQHMFAVPFENLDIHLGREIVLEIDRCHEKIVERRRGGFCYELNAAFAELLRRIGFDVTLLSAGVHSGGTFGPDFDHMALLVRTGGARWLADVGFGDSFIRPLLFITAPQEDPAGAFLLEPSGDQWTLFRNGEPQYRLTLAPRSLGDYAAMCRHHQTSSESSFTRKTICSRATPDGRITLSGSRLIVSSAGRRDERELADDRTWRDALKIHFGIELEVS